MLWKQDLELARKLRKKINPDTLRKKLATSLSKASALPSECRSMAAILYS